MAAYSVLDPKAGLNTLPDHSNESSNTEPIDVCFTVALAKLNALMQVALAGDLIEQPKGVVYNYLLAMEDQLEDIKLRKIQFLVIPAKAGIHKILRNTGCQPSLA